jgi:hypothetical protein
VLRALLTRRLEDGHRVGKRSRERASSSGAGIPRYPIGGSGATQRSGAERNLDLASQGEKEEKGVLASSGSSIWIRTRSCMWVTRSATGGGGQSLVRW